MRRVERGSRLMVSVTPPGFPVCDGSVLQGLRYRSTACLWSIAPTELPFRDGTPGYRGCAIAPPPACGLDTPTGFTRPDERMNANSTKGQTSFRREDNRQSPQALKGR